MECKDAIDAIDHARHLSSHEQYQFCERLVGDDQLWRCACWQAVQENADWLKPYLPDADGRPWPLDLLDDNDRRYYSVARCIAGCAYIALLLKSMSDAWNDNHHVDPVAQAELATLLYLTAQAWQQAAPATAVPMLSTDLLATLCNAPRWIDPNEAWVPAMLAALHHIQSDWSLAPIRDLVSFFSTGKPLPRQHVATVAVLLDLGNSGLVATLRLESYAQGLGQFYPDPCSMAFFLGDDDFQRALDNAWKYVHSYLRHDQQTDVRWSLEVMTARYLATYLLKVNGASIGAGCALGLLHLLTTRPLVPAWAITGNVTPTGEITSVSGLQAKLEAAHYAGKRVILPTDDLEGATAKGWRERFRSSRVMIRGASTVEQASAVVSKPPINVPLPERPPEEPDFVGRKKELADFEEKLKKSHLVVITGMPGIGKTTLAAQLARKVADPDKIFWHAFRENEGPWVILWKLAGFLAWHGPDELWRQLKRTKSDKGLPPPEMLFTDLLHKLHGQHYVLCLDDFQVAEDDPLLDTLVDKLLREVRAGRITLIVTSRHTPKFATSAMFEPLGGLDADASRLLLAKRGLALPVDLVEKLITLTGGNVQLLILSIDLLRGSKNPTRQIDHLSTTSDIESYLLREVHERLTHDQQTVMHVIAVMMGYPVSQGAIAAVLKSGGEGSLLQSDAYASFENGLNQLLLQIKPDHPRFADVLIYHQRLVDNIWRSQRYGDTETQRAERAEVISQLNELALAVVGQLFTALCGLTVPTPQLEQLVHVLDLRRTLNDLSGRNLLIVSESEGRSEEEDVRGYVQHTIVQAFYYYGLRPDKRRMLHQWVGEYYETVERDALTAARHFALAGETARAARLATADVSSIINRGQVQVLRRLLERLDTGQIEADLALGLYIAKGEVYTVLRKRDLAQECYDIALDLLDGLPDTVVTRARKVRISRGKGELLVHEAPQEALIWLQSGLKLLDGADPLEEALLHYWIGRVRLATGDFEAARQTLDQSLRLVPKQSGDLYASILMNLGTIACSKGSLDEGKRYFDQALRIYEQTQNEWRMATVRQNLGRVKRITGDWAGAADEYLQALKLAERLGNVTRIAALELNLGNLCIRQGDAEAADSHLAKCVQLARDHYLQEDLVAGLSSQADLSIQLGQLTAASRMLDEARQIEVEMKAKDQLPEINWLQAQIHLARGEVSEALTSADQAVAVARDLDLGLETGIALRVQGQTLLNASRRGEALKSFVESLALLERLDPHEAARTKAQWGLALLKGSNGSKGTTLVQEAKMMLEHLGAKYDLTSLEAELLRIGFKI